MVSNMSSPADQGGMVTGGRGPMGIRLKPCEVCGDKSTGYHFGVISCEACKVSVPFNSDTFNTLQICSGNNEAVESFYFNMARMMSYLQVPQFISYIANRRGKE